MSKTAFIFPGQASQFVGMGKDFYDKYEIARKYYDKANEILGFDLKNVSFEGPADDLKQTKITQPAIFVLSVIVNELLQQKGFKPDFTAGHSLGEYAALVACGSLSFEDGLRIVGLRGAEMQKAGEENIGTMAAIVGLTSDKVIECCTFASSAGIVQAANFNSPVQTVISGSVSGVSEAMKVCKENGAKIVKELVVSGAFHSPLMQSAVDPVQNALREVEIIKPFCSFVPNVTADIESNPESIKTLLVKQITAPVKWSESVEMMIREGVSRFIEVGPGKVLQGLVKSIDKTVTNCGVGSVEEFENFN
ncbi:MAG: ACP S-malonyltransferase [Candidatus Delongbacteria bacterium]|nr:ACP S-malonyltransferase [Candidatus Delongbacteria bacterium]MBN2837017.1 ACP S-malonyltransferase [Candidatus Delongbacteria bacterium]